MRKFVVVISIVLILLGNSVQAFEKQLVTFKVIGPVHRREKYFQLGRKKFYRYGLCNECWKTIRKEAFKGFGVEVTTTTWGTGKKADSPVTVFVTLRDPDKIDLGEIARNALKAKAPHKKKRVFFFVLFADLTKESERTALKALSKIKGVNRSGSKTFLKVNKFGNEEKFRANQVSGGAIYLKLNGNEKVSLDSILTALKEVGIQAETTKPKIK